MLKAVAVLLQDKNINSVIEDLQGILKGRLFIRG
jgi:hypothetical protein